MSNDSSPRESLASILSVERVRDGEYAARLEDFWGTSIGGDALARAVLAAAEDCEGTQLHSLHASFLRPAPPAVPLRLLVERLGDGRGLARRQVRLLDEGLLCQVVASFTAADDGLGYQDVAPAPDLPAPDELASTVEQARAEGWPVEYARGPIEFRRVGAWPRAPHESHAHLEWVRPRAPLPGDPLAQTAALVFLAGFYPHWEFERRIGEKFSYDRFASLDHALWVHRAPRWDDWWLLDAQSEIAGSGRALSRRRIYTRQGHLVASSAQEALVARA
jgi:acyl-CoA thioesterase-2